MGRFCRQPEQGLSVVVVEPESYQPLISVGDRSRHPLTEYLNDESGAVGVATRQSTSPRYGESYPSVPCMVPPQYL